MRLMFIDMQLAKALTLCLPSFVAFSSWLVIGARSQLMPVQTYILDYYHEGDLLKGFVAKSVWLFRKRPAVLVVPDRDGRDDYENNRAVQLATMGYIGFAVDIYGNGTYGRPSAEYSQLMAPFANNRTKLLGRMKAALDTVKTLSFVDSSKIAAQGYCFGGMAVLDMARANLDVLGVVSFHGSVRPPPSPLGDGRDIKVKVLVQNGYDDTSNRPDSVQALEDELKARNADFQVINYSNTVHAFTVPSNSSSGNSMFNALSDKRSLQLSQSFYKEIFGEE